MAVHLSDRWKDPMPRLNFAPRQTLPAPLSGILSARRPTGVILATIIAILAVYGSLIAPLYVYLAVAGTPFMPWWMTIMAFGLVIVII